MPVSSARVKGRKGYLQSAGWIHVVVDPNRMGRLVDRCLLGIFRTSLSLGYRQVCKNNLPKNVYDTDVLL